MRQASADEVSSDDGVSLWENGWFLRNDTPFVRT